MKMRLITILVLLSLKSWAGIIILNGLTHIHESIKGNIITGKIRVQNNGTEEAKILIYKEDIVLSCEKDKQTDYKEINSHERSSGGWIQLSLEEKLLQSQEIYDIIYTITTPEGVKGSYWSAVMIEGVAPIKEEFDKGIKIESKVRYAIQLISNIGTPIASKIDFENTKIQPRDSLQVLVVKLKNSDIFLSRIKVNLEIYDETGKRIKVFETTPKKIFPDKCTEFEIFLKDLPKGKYEGVIIADNGKDLFGANVSIDI